MSIKIGLIGEDISASLSPFLHEREGRENQLEYSYHLIDTLDPFFHKMPLEKLLTYAIDNQFSGLNITHPFKQKVVPYLDKKNKQVKELKSANTIIIKNGKLAGYNTDYFGYVAFLKQVFVNVKLGNILLVGSGGAGRAVSLALIDHGLQELILSDISISVAQELATLLKTLRPSQTISVCDVNQIPKKSISGVVNATPLGMSKLPGICVNPKEFSSDCWFSDIVYFPLQTEFLRIAKESGHQTFNGSCMAVYQAARSFRYFTGIRANEDRMMNEFINRVS